MAKKRTKRSITVADYKASLIVLGRTFEGVGETAQEAISAIDAGNVRGKGVLVVQHGENVQERVFPPTLMSRLFGPAKGLTREIALKQAALRFAV